MAKYSISSYTADGTTTDFLLTWDYLDKTHINVYVDDVNVADAGSGFTSTLINSTTVRVTTDLGAAVPAGKIVELRRETPIDTQAVTFNDGSSLNGGDLNTNTDYLLYAMQEAIDTIDPAAQEASVQASIAAVQSASEAASSASSAASSAASASSSETAAAASASAASSSASAALTSKNNAVAAELAAIAASSDATNSASAAAASATAAASSASAAAASESTVAASATAAAISETNAASSAANSASSASSAASSRNAAVAAATSATNTAAALTGFDLAAIAASKAVTAVDVFVYDTSKDSDGGAWRKRCQHTSWYNETLNTATRGSRREFPAVAVIVAEASKVTIYDGDDPSLPMWMVFNTGGYNSSNTMLNREGNPQTSVTALNGFVSVGTLQANNVAGGLRRISFIEDVGVNFTETTSANTGTYLGDISERNDQLGFDGVVVGSVVSRNINDVAMTVLPDAPIDPATGLPVPTIAVATDGGVSVIKDDGNVVDSAWTSDSDNVFFDGNNNLWFTRVSSFFGNFFVSNYAADGFTAQSFPRTYNISLNGGSAFGINAATGLKNSVAAFGGTNEWGITFAAYDPTAFSTKSMVAYTTSSYNTGWMPGDIKGAFLSSTDTASLVGSGELVTNGGFDTDTSGWTANTGFALSVVSQELNVAYTSGSGGLWYVGATQAITTVIGKTYVITFDVTALNGNLGRVRVEDNLGGGQNLNKGSLAVGSYSYTFVATGTTTYVNLGVQSDVTSDATYDNISVKLADADRSVNNNGLIVNGTVTRSAVATGAELVAYSGFSASNYLEQPYNSDLDFGTGDFCVMGWVGLASTSLQNYLSITDKSGGGFGTNGQITMRYSSGWSVVTASGTINSSTASAVGSFTQVAAVRSSGVLYLYINGVAVGSVSSAGSLGATNTASNLVVGGAYVAGIWSSGVSTKLALLRISATAPTPDQIKRIYEDEKVLFQENAACTLYGASDAVTALAHDSDTGLLHVGTSAGRSVFQGLRRVSNTTTAVGTAISASNGLVVEE